MQHGLYGLITQPWYSDSAGGKGKYYKIPFVVVIYNSTQILIYSGVHVYQIFLHLTQY